MAFRPSKKLSTWRRVALSAWHAPSDPTAYGTVELDCENALAYAARLRDSTGEKITLTHLVGKAVAMAIAAYPEVNGFPSHGRLMLRDSVDVFFQVSFFDDELPTKKKDGARARSGEGKQANLAGAKIVRADSKSVSEVARELRERAEAIRKRGEAETVKSANMMAGVPGPLLGLVTRAAAYASYDLGLDMRRFGVPRDPFGSCMVTNVGVFGLRVAHAPLLPFARVPIILTLGAVRDAPAVVGGKVVVRKTASIGVAFDHRIMDGYQAGMMAKLFGEIMASPEEKLGAVMEKGTRGAAAS
jgi:pyruvate/2-oxoglutarate dehydrogenase complex dihydrolipoamide acyltransferase (E2) component